MNWQFILQVGKDDKFSPPKEKDRKQIFVQLYDGSSTIHQNIGYIVDRFHLSPSEISQDFLNIAISIYSADRMIKREEAYDGWTRYITLYIPVSNTTIWEKQRDILLEAVRFLSGDYWEFEFRELNFKKESITRQPELPKEEIPKDFVLLSGGIDSFIGAIDILETTSDEVIFLSHYGSGGVLKSIQDEVIDHLKDQYHGRVVSIQPFVQPANSKELSQRSRSILFVGLGIFVSQGLVPKPRLYVCENGFISLNVPISPKRIGSNSTRTTHPYFIELIRKLIEELSLGVELVTPYSFKTKGEMLMEVKNRQVLEDGIDLTRSCSKSDLRWFKYDPKGHCGVCMPCIIRRASLRKAGMPEGDYLYDIDSYALNLSKSRGETLRALRIFLERYKKKEGTLIFDLLSNGPIPESSGAIDDFESVFRRGLDELITLLG